MKAMDRKIEAAMRYNKRGQGRTVVGRGKK